MNAGQEQTSHIQGTIVGDFYFFTSDVDHSFIRVIIIALDTPILVELLECIFFYYYY